MKITPADLVTLTLFESVTGYTEKAVRRKIEDGVWLERREFYRAPDRRILINMEGYYAWARGERVAA